MSTSPSQEKDVLKSAMERVANEQAQPADPSAPAKRGAGRPAKPAAAPTKKTAKITYIPLEAGDAPFTRWHGIKFEANVPREVAHPELIASAMNNPWFSVDGAPPAKRAPRAAPRDTSDDVQSTPEAKLGGVEIEEPEDIGAASGEYE